MHEPQKQPNTQNHRVYDSTDIKFARTGKFIETENRLVVSLGLEMGARIGFYWGDENVLKLHGGDSCTLVKFTLKKKKKRASLVAQWLRIHLPMQGTRVRALVREDPT